jgi:spectinomycin phosphotransferase/16S rRNA (guanine(1405)-N(7))-methyltransferase
VLEAMLGGAAAGSGPYAERVAGLFAAHAGPVRRLLSRHDALASGADPARAVLTHGEPHAGNTLRTADGWRLIDWDTARVAPPERDLWLLGDEVLDAYREATGVPARPDLLERYRLRWDIADLAVEAARFRRPHTGSADDDQAFEIVERVVTALPG